MGYTARYYDHPTEILNSVFKLVYDRLTKQTESLQHYMKHWNGKSGGIEGQLKVEFVAAIPSDVIKITTGSAVRGKPTGKKYHDLRLEGQDIEPIDVELKACTNLRKGPMNTLENLIEEISLTD